MADPADEFKDFAKVEQAYDKYRNSGLSIMALVITISSATFIGLYQDSNTKPCSFVFVLPVVFSLLQQLMHYFGSKHAARSRHGWYVVSNYAGKFKDNAELEDKVSDAEISNRKANFHFGISDQLCWIACSSLGVAAIIPLVSFHAFYTLALFALVILVFLLIFFNRQNKLKIEIQTAWPNKSL